MLRSGDLAVGSESLSTTQLETGPGSEAGLCSGSHAYFSLLSLVGAALPLSANQGQLLATNKDFFYLLVCEHKGPTVIWW